MSDSWRYGFLESLEKLHRLLGQNICTVYVNHTVPITRQLITCERNAGRACYG